MNNLNAKRLLVISDNAMMASFLKNEIRTQNLLDEWNVEYRYTIANQSPEEMEKIGATPIDIKSTQVVRDVVDRVDLIFSLHCKQIFPDELVTLITCINIHPGFNPYNRGWYPQVFSIINSQPVGASIHVMDEEVDHGPIIDQLEITVEAHDTSLDVYEKILDAEKALIRKNLAPILNGEFEATPPKIEGNYNSVKDFHSLCQIDLENVASFRAHINMLRALTHGSFRNAFFMENGKRIYVQIKLEPELIDGTPGKYR